MATRIYFVRHMISGEVLYSSTSLADCQTWVEYQADPSIYIISYDDSGYIGK